MKKFNPLTPPFDETVDITDAEAVDLTDGGDSSLHYHSSDRSRSNHTGTQTASTISDFNTAADARVTYSALNANGSVGTGASQVAVGNHSHAGGSAPIDQAAYTFNTTTTAADPTAGLFRFNNATIASITEVYFDQLGISSTDYSEFLKQLASGDNIVFQSQTTANKWVRFRVRVAATDNTGWFTLKVVYVSSGAGALFAGSENVNVLVDKGKAPKVAIETGSLTDTVGTDGDVAIAPSSFIHGAATPVVKVKGQQTAGSWTSSENYQIASANTGIFGKNYLVGRTAGMTSGLIPGWRLQLPTSGFPLGSTNDYGSSSGLLYSSGYYSSASGTMNGVYYPADASVPPIPLTFFSMHAKITVLPEANRTMYFGMVTMGSGATNQYGVGVEVTSAGVCALKTRDNLLSVYVTLATGFTIAANDIIIFERFGHRFRVSRCKAATPYEVSEFFEGTVTGASTGYAQIFANGSVGIMTDSNTGRIIMDYIYG